MAKIYHVDHKPFNTRDIKNYLSAKKKNLEDFE